MIKYREIAIEVLKQAQEPMTPSQIWEKAIEEKIVQNKNIVGKTPMATLASLLLRETNKGTYRGNETVFLFKKNPRRYWLKENSETNDD